MTIPGYWNRLAARTLSRRRALAGATALGGAAALGLVGCGSGSDGGSAAKVVGGLAEPRDTTAQAVRGNTYRSYNTRDADTLDVAATDNYAAFGLAPYYYSRLLKIKSGLGIDPAAAELDGDLAQRWEVTPDAQQWTFHLRPGVKMQNVSPLNGRALDFEDVSMSWDRFKSKSPRRQRYFMVDKVEVPDQQTVVFKLNMPYAPFGVIMADTNGFWVLPKEYARGELDGRNTAVGSGPWILDNRQVSATTDFRRNEGYFQAGLPYLDRIELPLVLEYAQRLAQFKAGNIHNLSPASSDVLQLRKDVPNALMWKGDFATGWPVIFFGRVDHTFDDIRLKRALSMALDRDLFIDTFYDVTKFRSQGFDVEVRWDNMISCGYRWWLDPRDAKEMGYPDKAPGKWCRHDLTEAKALLSAAGYPNGIDSEAHSWPTAGAQFVDMCQATIGMWADAGIRLKLIMDDFNTVFLPKSVVAGSATGLNMTPSGEYNEVDQVLRGQWQQGPRNPSYYSRAVVDDMITKQSMALDVQERKQILWELQKYLSDDMNYIVWNGQASSQYSFTQPWLMNVRVYRSAPDTITRIWIDPKKAPN